ncbi:hypothetical protein CDAR_365332 [Caerostris darwini]|uniref:Uncharacterized protein n=1 Tax=Caerostris darwini TaxID=1538125 RepID=A0AAV4NLE4_9ARAC|nr:hypothetical protein CDAR_365332 [Caerostris darwini]
MQIGLVPVVFLISLPFLLSSVSCSHHDDNNHHNNFHWQAFLFNLGIDINKTESTLLSQETVSRNNEVTLGRKSYDDNGNPRLAVIIAVPIASIVWLICCCYCVRKCCCQESRQNVIVMNQNTPAAPAAAGPQIILQQPIVNQNVMSHPPQQAPPQYWQSQPQQQQWAPPPQQQQWAPQQQQQQWAPQHHEFSPNAYSNPNFTGPTAPPPYNPQKY